MERRILKFIKRIKDKVQEISQKEKQKDTLMEIGQIRERN